jgi:hypothetical protein
MVAPHAGDSGFRGEAALLRSIRTCENHEPGRRGGGGGGVGPEGWWWAADNRALNEAASRQQSEPVRDFEERRFLGRRINRIDPCGTGRR